MESWIHIFCAAILFMCALAVDKGNFKTCDQSGFCKRQRSVEAGVSSYMALLSSVQIEPTKISFELLNKRNGVKFNAVITGLEHNMARLKISEQTPLIPRYEPPVGDVLVGEPAEQGFEVESQSSDSITLSLQSSKLVIQANPFRVDVVQDGEPTISVNARGLLKFEHTREKSQPAEQPEGQAEEGQEAVAKEDNKTGAGEEEEPDSWEETFKTHKDTKPHGPQSVGLDFSFPGYEFVYGIPEHADTLALKTTKNTDPYRLYNLDVFEYELNNPMALYGSVPVMLAHNEKRTVGLFWLNAAETWIDISSNTADRNMFSKLVDFVKGDSEIPQVDTHWFSESGIIDVFFLLGPTAKNIFSQYAILTGTTPLPPLFAIAYHQSRWNYNDEQDVANVDAGFDEHNIPLDVIWLDIEHTDGKRYFTWDINKFPSSKDMINKVASKSRKMVTIVDPHIKRDDQYHIHRQAVHGDLYIKNKDGGDYDGWCWPGSSSWLDFLDPKIREYWASKFRLEDYEGSTLDLYTWNDMNEPSVFNGPEITMHKDAKHYGGWEHRDIHNIYGLYVHRSTVEGQLLRSDNKLRPFVLSRAFFAGSQRYGAIWTGDNTGDWGHLKISLPMTLSLNLVGITLSGADVGGFFKNPEPELLTRWYQAAAYMPFFRAHAHLDTRRREPWLLPHDHMKSIKSSIEARYKLLPYWYTLFYNSAKDGQPVMRPLWVEFPSEKNTFAVEDEFLVGPGLLVHPVTDNGATGVNVFFPGTGQVWYDIDTYQVYQGGQNNYISADLQKIPVYYRGGYIIPKKERVRRASYLGRSDPYTLVVALNTQGQAEGDLYLDDYQSFEYQKGEYSHRSFVFKNNQLVSSNADPQGTFSTPSWVERVVVLGVQQQPSSIALTISGGHTKELTFKYTNNVLTIKKPDVNIAEDWTITLK